MSKAVRVLFSDYPDDLVDKNALFAAIWYNMIWQMRNVPLIDFPEVVTYRYVFKNFLFYFTRQFCFISCRVLFTAKAGYTEDAKESLVGSICGHDEIFS